VIAGVCQGAARYFDIDPVILRVVLAVLTVFGGAGFVIYALAWLLIPDENRTETHLERWLHTGHIEFRQAVLVISIAICLVIFLANVNVFAHRIGAAAVAVLAALLLTELVGRRNGRSLFGTRPRSTAPPVYYGPEPAPAAPASPGGGATAAYPLSLPIAAPAPRERAWLGWVTFGLVLLTAGVLSVVATSGAAHLQPADVLAACVAVCGVGLVIGAFAGRARAIIPLGLLLVLALGLANALPRNLTWTAGTRSWTPVPSDLASSYVLGAGKADLDLSHLGAATTATIDARMGAGRLIVYVPRRSGVVIDAKVGAGRMWVLGHEQDGTGVSLHRVILPAAPGAGTLTLHLEDGFGDVEVRNAAA
jgi:phage shock protein PspC (stress-responsive transcriptional regulator)